MKKILLAICILIMAGVSGYAQKSATLEVSYKYSHPVQTMRSAISYVTNQYVLLTDGTASEFYSPKTEMIDSIESTPEGFEAFNTYKRVCWETMWLFSKGWNTKTISRQKFWII